MTKELCYLLLGVGLFSACTKQIKTGDDLSTDDTSYIRSLGLLAEGETVLLFDSQGGFKGAKLSGNFITDRRIASYWTDKSSPRNTSINQAAYRDIDTITATDMSQAFTYASYLTVRTHDKGEFKVYVDANSSSLRRFYQSALAEWRHAKRSQ